MFSNIFFYCIVPHIYNAGGTFVGNLVEPIDRESMTMQRILLIRHGTHDEVGQVLSGRSAIPLNAAGHQQALALSRWLKGERIDAVFSSPRQRARETAAPLAERLGCNVVAIVAWDEIDFGTFAGRSFASLASDPAWQRWNSARAVARCPGGETMGEAVQRALAHLHTLPHGTTAIVTHCDIIRGVVTALLGLPLGKLLDLDCDPGSVTTLTLDAAGARLVALNERWR